MDKQSIKQSEARILVYLSVVHNTRKHVTAIANTLETDYSYTMRILQAMTAKGWLFKHRYKRHVFYDISSTAPLEQARNAFNSNTLEQSLNNYTTPESTGFSEEKTAELNRDIQEEQKTRGDDYGAEN